MSAITAKASRKMKKYAVLTREPRSFLGSFDFSWEQRKLEDYLTVSVEKNTGNIYGRSDVLSVSGDYGIVNQIEFQGRSFAGASVSNYGVVQTGDVVYTKSPLNSNPYGIIKTNKGKPGIVSTLYAVYHPKENAFSDFIQVYFEQHARMNNYMHPLVNKGAKNDMKVSAENALKGPVCFPSRIEQESVSAFFSVLDNLITLHQRKCANLCSPSQVVFSLLFATSTFSWEQRKLGEMGQTYTGLSGKTKDDFGHGQARFVTYMNVFSNPISNPEMTEPIEIDPKQNEVEVGDVFFTTSSETPEEVGMSSILLEKRGKTYLNSFCFGFRPSEKIDSYYLAYMLRSESARAKITLLAQGISRYNISKNKVMEIAVSLPSLDEQKMIGQYFSQLDNLITLHQRECISFTGRADRLILTANKKRTTSSWEQRKLGELALFNPKDELPQTFEYVDLESVVGTEMLSHRTEVKSSAPSRAQRLAHTGDLFYQTVRPYQKNNYLFEKPDNNYVFSTGYAQMRPYVDGYFLLSLVQSERFVKVVLDNCTGTSYPAINANDLAEIEVAAPSDESEAQKIGTIFRSIDNLITLHQRKPFLMKWRTSDANRNQTNRLVL